MLYFHKVCVFLSVLSIEIYIDSMHPVQAGWIQKMNEANAEELKSLKTQCSIMLTRKDNSVKTQRRWANRLKLVEQRERGLKREAKKISNTQLMRQNLAKKQGEEAISIEEWPKNLELLSAKDLNFLQAGNLVMTLKRESGKSPDANEMLVYIQNKMNLSPDQGKFILEELGLANF